LAQNPNLLRTLLGLSFTLIFMLSYAVYGATVSPSYYLYQTDASVTVHDDIEPVRIYQDDQNTTTWTWSIPANGANLTWVNLTAVELSDNAEVRLINSAGLFSHPLLGAEDADGFSCSEDCYLNSTHTVFAEDGGEVTINALTSTDPARRSNGTVYAKTSDGRTRKPAMPSNTHIHHPSYGLKSWKPETEPPHQAPASSPSTKLLPHSNHSQSTQPLNSCGLWQQWLDASRWFSFHPSQSTLPQMRRKRGTQSAWQTRKRKWKMHSTPQKRPLDGRQFPHIC